MTMITAEITVDGVWFWMPFDVDVGDCYVVVRRSELRLGGRYLNLSICFASKIEDCLFTFVQRYECSFP